MSSLLAVLTYNRRPVLEACLASLEEHCPEVQTVVFEDGGYMDDTVSWLTRGRGAVYEDKELETIEYMGLQGSSVFIGTANLGVAGNSNRALRYFMRSHHDHLLLCNDDILASGDFAELYEEAHRKTGIEMFCRTDIDNPTTNHGWTTVPYCGYLLRISTRLTGNMLSLTKRVVREIGYFDTSFGHFGEEHNDYTYRASMSGLIQIDRETHTGVDIDHELLRLQETDSSVPDRLKVLYSSEAVAAMQAARARYSFERHYRPFSTRHRPIIGTHDAGVRAEKLYGHVVVNDQLTPCD